MREGGEDGEKGGLSKYCIEYEESTQKKEKKKKRELIDPPALPNQYFYTIVHDFILFCLYLQICT